MKGSVLHLAQDFASGATSPSELPPIRLFEEGGNLYSLANRRLFAGQVADVNLPYRMATQPEIDSGSLVDRREPGRVTVDSSRVIQLCRRRGLALTGTR